MDFIRPKLLNTNVTKAWFTLNNAGSININSSIKGLNLGYNTNVATEEIDNNRWILADNIGTDLNDIAYATQVHGAEIKEVNHGGLIGECDGLITNQRGVALAIQVADCAAILFADDINGVIGAAHAGWRGAIENIAGKIVVKMEKLGANLKAIRCYISPCISLSKFEVGQEVADKFPEVFVDYKSYQKPHIDLRAYINKQLVDAGVLPENIEVSDDCTIQNTNYYSYRRQKEKSGRMMAIIKMV